MPDRSILVGIIKGELDCDDLDEAIDNTEVGEIAARPYPFRFATL